MANIPSPADQDAADTAVGEPSSSRLRALIFFGFLAWTALVMSAFILNSASHILNKLKEFGVL